MIASDVIEGCYYHTPSAVVFVYKTDYNPANGYLTISFNEWLSTALGWDKMSLFSRQPPAFVIPWTKFSASTIFNHHPLYKPQTQAPASQTSTIPGPVVIKPPVNYSYNVHALTLDQINQAIKDVYSGTAAPIVAKCECGSAKCGSPMHSSWCPIKGG